MSYSIENGIVRYCNDLTGGGRSSYSVKGADVPSFSILNQTWARDRKHVWADGQPIRKVNPTAFEALNTAFGRDDRFVFDSLGRVVKDVAPGAFEVLDDGLQKRAAGGCTDSSYARCEGRVYHYEWGDHRTMWLRGADAASFRALRWNYGCDERRVYSSNLLVRGADAQSYRQITPHFAVDARSVFYFNRSIPEADPQTFEVFASEFWKKNTDLESAARSLGKNFWARDARWVYHQDRVVLGADPETATPVGKMLKDEKRVYQFLGKPVKVADVASFEAINTGYPYFRDNRHVYCAASEWTVMEGADWETFEQLPAKHPSRGDAWDKHWIYRNYTERWKPRSEYSAK